MGAPVLELRDITCYLKRGTNIFSNISFTVNEGDIVVLQGRSGSGKSTLLKCISHLTMHTGESLYRGRTALDYGIPAYRTKILYVPQRPSLLPGSPFDFLVTITKLRSHQALARDNANSSPNELLARAIEVGEAFEIQADLWHRSWMNLSGGEGQRILLAAAISLDTAEILLLDEPTSALDQETSLLVEQAIVERVYSTKTTLKAVIWISHSPEQSRRVGSRFIHLSAGGCYETDDPTPSPSPSTPVG
ncbi:Phosphate import ATP-binding protein PstB 1 [Psilocybe cubensis]|uniref:Phosphate import ATP-binding protein PstB 1 n=2 Tax=Psilocybe cubensis TaxID=181762 RepID=A0ACB8HAN4_PSICU|nr:Phosphate import ATP-binding protein PstB 1 [Psilocybe cubensis]KAH9484264.1 Phosphate import ATP-binding protein PstB 1 [Psilocybe cubensis]